MDNSSFNDEQEFSEANSCQPGKGDDENQLFPTEAISQELISSNKTGSAEICAAMPTQPDLDVDDHHETQLVDAFKTAVTGTKCLFLLPDSKTFLLKSLAGVHLHKSLLEKAANFLKWTDISYPVQVQDVVQIRIPYVTIHALNSMKNSLRKHQKTTDDLGTDSDATNFAALQLVAQACELLHEYHRMMQFESFDEHLRACEFFKERYASLGYGETEDDEILATAVYLREMSPDGRIPVIITSDVALALLAKNHNILAVNVENLNRLVEFIGTSAFMAPALLPASSVSPGTEHHPNNHKHQIPSSSGCSFTKEELGHNHHSTSRKHDSNPGTNIPQPKLSYGRPHIDRFSFGNDNTPRRRAQPPAARHHIQTSIQQDNAASPSNRRRHGQEQAQNSTRFSDDRNRQNAHGIHVRRSHPTAPASADSNWERMYPLDNTPQNLLLYKRKLTGYLQDLLNDVIRMEIYTRALEQSHLPTDVVVDEAELSEEATMWLTYTYSAEERKGCLADVFDALVALQKHNRALLDNYARELKLERLLDSIVSRMKVGGDAARAPANDLPRCANFKDVHRWGSEIFPLVRALTQRQPPWSPSFTQRMRRTPQIVLSHFRKILGRISELCVRHNIGGRDDGNARDGHGNARGFEKESGGNWRQAGNNNNNRNSYNGERAYAAKRSVAGSQ